MTDERSKKLTTGQKNAHQLTDSVKLLQKVVLLADDRVLLLKRSPDAKTRPGCWDLPGGNVEWPKSKTDVASGHVQELVREVREETGLQLDEPTLASLSICLAETYFEANQQRYTVILGWALFSPVLSEQKITLSDEHTESAWVPLTEAVEYDFGFAGGTDGFITKLLATLDSSCECDECEMECAGDDNGCGAGCCQAGSGKGCCGDAHACACSQDSQNPDQKASDSCCGGECCDKAD